MVFIIICVRHKITVLI